jgi:hypothetical protein
MYLPNSSQLISTHSRIHGKTASIRADDHSTIGAALFAVLTPAVFWKRARAVHRKHAVTFLHLFDNNSRVTVILGGAGIGSSIGLLTHWGRTISGDPPPRVEIPSPPVQS